MKNCLMLQNTKFTAFTVSELLRENLHWGVNIPPSTQIGVNIFLDKNDDIMNQAFKGKNHVCLHLINFYCKIISQKK